MPQSYVDEIVVRYLMKRGYLILQGIWFPLKREKTGKKVSAWSDIDIFAVKPNEPLLIIQCKSFLGTAKSEEIVNKIVKWFEYAEDYLKNSTYNKWAINGIFKKVLVVDWTVKQTEKELIKRNIEVWLYKDILKELLEMIQNEQKTMKKGHIGKEEDTLLKIFSDMLRQELIDKEKIKK